MKAIRVKEFGSPEVMRLEEVPDPQPDEGQVLVKVEAAGVNPVDTYIRAGAYPTGGEPPFTPGFDAAGTVVEIGPGVGHTKKGDRVYVTRSLTGTYAELALCDEEDVHPLPERISFAQGAGIGIPFATAWYALNVRAHALAGEFVLVHGASGGVGTAAVQIAHAAGMRVIGTAGTDKGKKLAEDLGAYAVLDHGKAGYLDEIHRLTCEHGVDVVLEMLADVNLNKDLKVLAKGGRIVVIGCRGAVEIEPREAMGKNADICGMVIFNASRQEKRTMHAALVAGLANGTLKPIKGKELTLSEAAQAHKDVMSSGAYGKIVLIP